MPYVYAEGVYLSSEDAAEFIHRHVFVSSSMDLILYYDFFALS